MPTELTPKIVAEAFYNGEMENELRQTNCVDYVFCRDGDIGMEVIERIHHQNIYPHLPSECTEDCKSRGKKYQCTRWRM